MKSSKTYFLLINIIFFLFLIIQVGFLCFNFFILKPYKDDDFFSEFLISDIIVIVLCLCLAYFFPQKIFKKAQQRKGIREKLMRYKNALLLRWLLIFIASIYSIVEYMLTGEFAFIFTSIFSIIVFILTRVTKSTICEHLDLDSKEKRIIFNPNAAI